jgi:chaperonin GroEL (HSP60 family)
MVKNRKKEDLVKKGNSFEKSVMNRLTDYADENSSGNRSAVVNYLFGALFQK